MASLNDIASWGALNTQGFSLPSFSYSVGGKAVCVSGMVDVPVIATTFDVLYKGPANNYELTEFITGFFRRESDILATSIGDSKTINSTFAIYTKLCLPADLQAPPHRNSVQFLTHGGTLDHTYWEFAPEYSYVDVAAAKGFATFSYDRLGAAKSAHADPWQHLQMSVQKDIAHKLIQMLRSGNIGGITFRHIVGVGHSLGAALTQAVSGDYPSDFDAIALTGHSAFSVGASTGFAAAAQQIANTLPDRPELKDLPNGYYTLGPIPQTLQFGFFYYPHFDIEIFKQEFRTRQTNAIGETLTLGALYTPTAFKGPVQILNGQQDWFYCQGNCVAKRSDITTDALNLFYPERNTTTSQAITVPNTGHNINLHFSRLEVFEKMLSFISGAGIEP